MTGEISVLEPYLTDNYARLSRGVARPMYASREKGRVGVPTERRLVMMVPVVIGTDRHALTVEGLEEIGFLY